VTKPTWCRHFRLPPFAKNAKERGTHCVGDASEIKSLGLPPVTTGRRLLITDASRRTFESALDRVRSSFRLQVYGYLVMPEHVHLLLSEPQEDTSNDRTAPLKPKAALEWATCPTFSTSLQM
jgi:hypothetical protein